MEQFLYKHRKAVKWVPIIGFFLAQYLNIKYGDVLNFGEIGYFGSSIWQATCMAVVICLIIL